MMLKLIPVILLEIKIIGKPDFFYDASKTIPKWNIFTLDPEIKTSGLLIIRIFPLWLCLY